MEEGRSNVDAAAAVRSPPIARRTVGTAAASSEIGEAPPVKNSKGPPVAEHGPLLRAPASASPWAANPPRFFPELGTSGTAPQSFRSASVLVAPVRTPNCEMRVGGYPCKSPAFMFRTDAGKPVQGIFEKAFLGRCHVLARDMQTGYSVVFDEPAGSHRARPGTVVGPDGAGM